MIVASLTRNDLPVCVFSLFSLLHEKRKELGDAASKLRNGLDKIDDTRAKVFNKCLIL